MGDVRFLAVEDEPFLVQGLARSLRSVGQVVGAGSLAEARSRLADDEAWAAVIVDRKLPDGCGLALLPEIRERRPLVPIVVVTGQVDAEAAVVTYDHRAELLAKPYECSRMLRFARGAVSIEARVRPLVREWATRHKLTPALADLLRRLVLGEERADIAKARGTTEPTVQTQVSGLLLRTSDRSAQDLVARFLRELARS